MRLKSYLLCGLFSAEKKAKHFLISACARGHSRSCLLNRSKPGQVIETRSDRRNSFFANDTIFSLFMPRSKANVTTFISQNNAWSFQKNLAHSAANQSARTIIVQFVAIKYEVFF